jgi:uncharacterized membrane protein YfcA
VPRPLVIFGIAFVSTLIGAMSGGSASLLMTPSWLALGFPLATAVAADKVAGTVWTLVGAANYLERRTLDRRLIAGMIVVGVVGAAVGTRITMLVDPGPLKRVVGALILGAVLLVVARPRVGTGNHPPRLSRRAMSVAAFPFGVYEGLLGSGNSIAVSLLVSAGRGVDLLTALGHYYLVAAAWCGFAAAAYWAAGAQRLELAVPATAGAIAGGYLGSRIGSRRGLGFVRALFVVAGIVLGVKLLLGW